MTKIVGWMEANGFDDPRFLCLKCIKIKMPDYDITQEEADWLRLTCEECGKKLYKESEKER